MPEDRPLNATPLLSGTGPRSEVSLKEATLPTDQETPAERTFETKATRLRLTDDEHADLAQRLGTVLDAIQHERDESEVDANWDLWEDLYFGVLQDRPAGQANVHVPLSQEVVDTALAVVEQALFTARPWLQLEPREPMDVAQAKRKEQFLDFGLNVEMQAKERLDPILWEAAVLGTGVGYLPWLRETDRIRDEETYDGANVEDLAKFEQRYPDAGKDFPELVAKLKQRKTITLTVEYNEARQDAPELTYIPVRKWLVRPAAVWHKLHRERFVGHTFEQRYAALEELVEDSYYDDRLQRLAFSYEDDGTIKDDPTFRDKVYEISTGILRWKRPNDSRERRYLVDFHRDSRTILRILHYPYWHNRINYIPWYFQRSRKSIYGISLIQKVESSQFEANAAHSLTLDAVAFGAIPMFKARKGLEGTFNPMRDGMYSGKTWYFDNPESDAQAFQTSVSSAVSVLLNLEDRATRHSELASGATQNLSGLESARDPQAPASKTLQQTQQALVRIGKYLSTLGWSLSELGFQVCELYYQFSPSGKTFRVVGPEGSPVFEQISRPELRLRADYYPHGSTAALNPEREQQADMDVMKMLMQIPEVGQNPLKRMALIEMMLDARGPKWVHAKRKVLPTAEELQAMTKPPTPPGPPGAPAPTNGNGMPPQMAALLGSRMGPT